MTKSAVAVSAVPALVSVMKRDGRTVSFDRSKIEIAVLKCFMDPKVQGADAAQSTAIREKVSAYTDEVLGYIKSKNSPVVGIEDIQDMVEKVLMANGEHVAAREYVLFRDRRASQRKLAAEAELDLKPRITLINEKGERVPLDEQRLTAMVSEACNGLEGVDAQVIIKGGLKQLYDGAKLKDLDDAMILASRQHIEEEPDYAYATARLLLDTLRREVLRHLAFVDGGSQAALARVYPQVLTAGLKAGVQYGMVDPRLLDGRFDLDRLGCALKSDRDFKFDYLGLQTLYDRYFLHQNKVRYELPQTFYMRVAMGLALNESDPTVRAVEFYEILSSHRLQSSTPTLFNAGTTHSQLSSCYLTTVPDDLFGIFGAIQDNAMLSKFAGGLGNDWTPVRGLGAHIKGTNGKSQGTVPFLKVANDTAVAVNQGGKRKGAVCAYLETWHTDIEEFLDLRKNTGDDRRRTHDMNTANWVPDLFMERVLEGGSWTLFTPNEVPELHDLVGNAFKAKYEEYEAKAAAGEIKVFKKVAAGDLWKKMLSMLFETGHPWITFKDPCNIRSPQQHCGVVHSSNLCTEITLNTKANEEIAVCNLASVNVPAHMDEHGNIDQDALRATVNTGMRMLDNVIDINYYAVDTARQSNMRHRPVGLGLMGFHDALYMQGVAYASPAAVKFADLLMESISYYAIDASAEMARERGAYQSFQGSLWSQGILPIDSIALLKANRKEGHLVVDTSVSGLFDWNVLREKVKGGMRNSNTMAIAPTATIADIVGVSQSIEPTYGNLKVKSNLSGEFTCVNSFLVKALKARGLWDKVMLQDLKFYDGSVQKIDRIPTELKSLFAIAFEIDPNWLIEAAARRQKWIDQAQSLNLYMAVPNGKALKAMYEFAWIRGLKTTYYLRSLGKTGVEKSTVDKGTLNAVQMAPQAKVCSIERGADCEACQ